VDIAGVFPALTTPYADDGSVALDKFKLNIERYNKTAIAGCVVLGSTGESVLLSREESEALIMRARLKAGWITEADLAPPAADEAAAAEAQA